MRVNVITTFKALASLVTDEHGFCVAFDGLAFGRTRNHLSGIANRRTPVHQRRFRFWLPITIHQGLK